MKLVEVSEIKKLLIFCAHLETKKKQIFKKKFVILKLKKVIQKLLFYVYKVQKII